MYLSGVLLAQSAAGELPGSSRIFPDLSFQKLLLGGPEGQKERGVTCR
jgi:hypothetical protein